MDIINWRLISHPMNWVELFLMVFLGLIALHFILDFSAAQKVQPV